MFRPLLLAPLALLCCNLLATEISFTHDSLSRRVEKRVDGTRIKAWLWADDLRPIAELDAANAVTLRFVYAGSANVPSHALKGTNTFRLITDPRGSVRLVVNAQTGEIVQRLDYDEFGRVPRDTNPGFQPFGFAGGLYDPDTGLVRFGARDYYAQTARWADKDPIRFDGGSPNLYAYVANDPVNLTDAAGTGGGLMGGVVSGLTGDGTVAQNATGSVTGDESEGSSGGGTICPPPGADEVGIVPWRSRAKDSGAVGIVPWRSRFAPDDAVGIVPWRPRATGTGPVGVTPWRVRGATSGPVAEGGGMGGGVAI